MKLAYTVIIAGLMFAVVACRHEGSLDGLSDKEKLEVLDYRIEQHPDSHELLAKRAQVLLNLGRTNEAMADAEKAVKIESSNVDYKILLADIRFAGGDADGSYSALADAERLDPENDEVQLKLGEVAFYRHNYERALQCLSKVTEADPDNRTALFMKAFIYEETGDTSNAIVLLRKVCDLYPDYAPAFEHLGVLYSYKGNNLAEDYLGAAIRIDSTNTNAMYALAMYYQDKEQYDKAEAFYNKMLAVNPNSADAMNNMGWIEKEVYGDDGRAKEWFERALQADPTNEAAQKNMSLYQK